MLSALFLGSALFMGDLYVVIFAWQDTPTGIPPHPCNTHSFATWVTVNGSKIDDAFTISWAAPHGVHLLRGPEPGQNLTLDQTLEFAEDHSLHVTCWGPYRVSQEGWDKARQLYSRLEEAEQSHAILYKALDRSTRHFSSQPAINCIHALTDVATSNIITGDSCGVSASQLVVNVYRSSGIIERPDTKADWLVRALCGDRPIQREQSDVPTVQVQMVRED